MAVQVYRVINKLTTGGLRHPIRIQRKNNAYDSIGGHGPGIWADYIPEIWAYIASWGQVENYRQQQNGVEITQLCVVRYDPGKPIIEDMAVFLESGHPQGYTIGNVPGRRWKINFVENYEERNIWLIIAGTEIKPTEADG